MDSVVLNAIVSIVKSAAGPLMGVCVGWGLRTYT